MRPPVGYHQFHKCPHRYHGDFHKKFEKRDFKKLEKTEIDKKNNIENDD